MGTPLPERLSPISLTLATAVPKGDRFDWLVEKATELGVERLIPIVTERSVVVPGEPKLSRLQRSIIEASKQCRRDRLMVLDPPTTWASLAESSREMIKYLADPHGLPAADLPRIRYGQAAIVAVGPEGGFAPAERALAGRTGWLELSLNANTLRIETAGLVGCALLFTRAEESDECPKYQN
jgi:16S rRNA (uracil1498-N3)-methyltransferase